MPLRAMRGSNACVRRHLPSLYFCNTLAGTGAWGCGVFNGDRYVKFLVQVSALVAVLLWCGGMTSCLQWLAASAAGLSEVEYVAFGDDSHGDIVSEFVQDIISLPSSQRTVRVLRCLRRSAVKRFALPPLSWTFVFVWIYWFHRVAFLALPEHLRTRFAKAARLCTATRPHSHTSHTHSHTSHVTARSAGWRSDVCPSSH